MPVRHARTTTAPVAAVWAWLADPNSYAAWVSGTVEIRRADPAWPAPGAQLHHRFGPWPWRRADRTTVLACDPQARLVLLAAARPWGVARVELTLLPLATGARVVLCEQLVDGPGRRFPLLGWAVQWLRNRRSLARLVRLVEESDRRPS